MSKRKKRRDNCCSCCDSCCCNDCCCNDCCCDDCCCFSGGNNNGGLFGGGGFCGGWEAIIFWLIACGAGLLNTNSILIILLFLLYGWSSDGNNCGNSCGW
ncbi:hypothetical protein ACQPU1_13770 [Clostridium paraputrificum]|uniref:hypothetical protein n=1 Tax=Clostridium paraputrificum TaxID=29363 RepID=UPI003D328BFC